MFNVFGYFRIWDLFEYDDMTFDTKVAMLASL